MLHNIFTTVFKIKKIIKKKALDTNTETTSQLWSTEEGTSCLEVLIHRASEQWIKNYTKISFK